MTDSSPEYDLFVAELRLVRADIASLRDELRSRRKKILTRKKTLRQSRADRVARLQPSELDVERAKRLLRRTS